MNTIGELKDKNAITQIMKENWHENDDSYLPPMFHGTDESLINISIKEKDSLNEACEEIIKTVFKLYKDNYIDLTDKRLMACRDGYGCSSEAYGKAEARLNNSPLYSYGDFFVTNFPDRAINYSKEAWILGETGRVANLLIEGAKALDIELPTDEKFLNALNMLNYRKQRLKSPVVLMLVNGKSYDFRRENGEPPYENLISGLKSKSFNNSYRLGNQTLEQDVRAYIIKEEYYGELKDAWNNIEERD